MHMEEKWFEVKVMTKTNIEYAGAEPLTWSKCNRKVKMPLPPLFDQSILIQSGKIEYPLTGMTMVVYSRNHKECPIEVHVSFWKDIT